MKKLLSLIILSFLPYVSQAKNIPMEIDCWASQNHIYHGLGYNVAYGDSFLFFSEKNTGKTVYVNAACVVKFYQHAKKTK